MVINEETVNAFVLPGGKIVVFTGEPGAFMPPMHRLASQSS